MAIRIRVISGHTVALNAAITKEQEGDIYLHDGIHTALGVKFGVDFKKMGFMEDDVADPIIKNLMITEELKYIMPDGFIQ